MIWWGTILSVIVTLLLLICLIWLILRPSPLKFIMKCMQPPAIYDPDPKYAEEKSKYTIYTEATAAAADGKAIKPKQQATGLIVVFVGGAMLTSNRKGVYGALNYIYSKQEMRNYDLLVFSYPVRFKYTLHDTMLAINEVLKDFVNYERIHAIGFSIGTLLAGAFYHKEQNKSMAEAMKIPQIGMQFTSFIGVCGMYESKFAADVLTKIFRFYILKNTPASIYYTCYGMTIPRFIISSTSDFLFSQTSKYIQEQSVKYKVYNSKTLPHSFPQYINFTEARDSLDKMMEFIQQVDRTTMPRV